MVDSKKFTDWIQMGKKDFRAAQILYEHEGDRGLVCFHCQQAVEKYLKAFLLAKTGIVHEGHNLLKLLKKALEFEPSLSEFAKDVSFVNMFYIEVRYPPDEPMYVSVEDTEECLQITQKIMRKIEEALNMNL
ncbi:HEPN domain-containing protein [Caldicellulosiruptor acetigenus]|uniref:HEPN domain protein n=1 Tax=Caldicellulosiruptor acetigenus 6A TaxID=632516 RepID=G2PWH2_9FIRM|nr:HEPN domain-containing protein [Caldicellulosiruptor acetigenus]AEM72916.1 HEPN domain protein [Caldicellulosiruptor acetigenus 6A]